MSYWELPLSAPGVVMWGRPSASVSRRSLILPDGCMDVIWDGRAVFVAGPDSSARWHISKPGTTYVGLRFSSGVGSGVLDVDAHEIRDRTPAIDELLSSHSVRLLCDGIEEDPGGALARWLGDRLSSRPVDPLGPRIQSLSSSGTPVSELAWEVGFSERQLRRRCETLFGYGPRRLGRILRFGRALEAARAGVGWSEVAATCGYADQAHLSREIKELTGLTPTTLLAPVSSGQRGE